MPSFRTENAHRYMLANFSPAKKIWLIHWYIIISSWAKARKKQIVSREHCLFEPQLLSVAHCRKNKEWRSYLSHNYFQWHTAGRTKNEDLIWATTTFSGTLQEEQRMKIHSCCAPVLFLLGSNCLHHYGVALTYGVSQSTPNNDCSLYTNCAVMSASAFSLIWVNALCHQLLSYVSM